MDPRAVRRDHPRAEPSAEPDDLRAGCRRDHAEPVGLRRAREADGVLRGRVGRAAALRTISVPAACRRTCRPGWTDRIAAWAETFPKFIDDLEELLTDNRIWKQRTVDIGVISAEQALAWGFTGPPLRASGVPWDLRRAQPYDKYAEVDFKVPVGRNGDCYDRYLMRIDEMRESVKIIKQCLAKMKPGPVKVQDHKFSPPHARRDEALDGSADPSLQALHRGLSRAGRRDLHRGGKPEGRVRRLSGRRRHQPAVSLQDPPDRVRLPAGDRCDGASGTCWRMSARSSDRWTSCSARSTGKRWPKQQQPTSSSRRISPSTPRARRRSPGTSRNIRRAGRPAR